MTTTNKELKDRKFQEILSLMKEMNECASVFSTIDPENTNFSISDIDLMVAENDKKFEILINSLNDFVAMNDFSGVYELGFKYNNLIKECKVLRDTSIIEAEIKKSHMNFVSFESAGFKTLTFNKFIEYIRHLIYLYNERIVLLEKIDDKKGIDETCKIINEYQEMLNEAGV